MRRARQHIFLLRDCFSSFTVTQIITNEQSDTLRSALITTTAELKVGTGCIVRVDGAKAFQSLLKDHSLKKHGIQLQPGRVKNRNKHAVVEKAIQELEIEIKKQHPEGGPLTSDDLATATSTLNARIRDCGLSSREILHQRDGVTGEQLNFTDSILADKQYKQRQANHEPSSRSQAPKGKSAIPANVGIGDLIFLKCDGDKHLARDKYIVICQV